MNLIPQWQQLWKMYSVQLAGLLALLNLAATYWPSFQALLSPSVWAAGNAIIGLAIGIARAIPQSSITPVDDKPAA